MNSVAWTLTSGVTVEEVTPVPMVVSDSLIALNPLLAERFRTATSHSLTEETVSDSALGSLYATSLRGRYFFIGRQLGFLRDSFKYHLLYVAK